MKVALCTEILYPLYGVEKRVYEMAVRLPKYGWDVEVITSSSTKHFPNLNIVQVSNPTIINPPKRNYTNVIKFLANSYREVRKKKYDIIDANGHLALLGCNFGKKKRPFIGTIHDLYGNEWGQMYNGKGAMLGKIMENIFVNFNYTRLITINNTLKHRLEKRKKRGVDMIPSGIDTKEIDKIKSGKKENTILYVGRLVGQKNVESLIRAFANSNGKDRGYKLKIVGEGSEKNNLEKLSKELKAKVEFTGRIENYDNVIREMKKASFLVLSSRRENFGIVPLESMYCRTPVISTDTEGPKDYIDGENGFIVKNEEMITNKINELCDDKSKIIRMSALAREKAKKYDWDLIVKKISNVYEDVL